MPAKDRTKRRATPNQERAHATVNAILDAAAELLQKRGFKRTSTNQIAVRAGVNVALVYRYFAGKEAIVGALIDRFAAETLERARAALASSRGAPFETAIRDVLQSVVGTPHSPELHRELFERVTETERRQVFQATGDAIAALFEEFLDGRGLALRPELDREATLFVLRHAIESAAHAAAFYRPPGLSQERAIDALSELVIRSLLPVRDGAPALPLVAPRADMP